MSKIRILRLIEYTYSSSEVAERDIGHWAIPANGKKEPSPNLAIRSAIITDLDFEAGMTLEEFDEIVKKGE